LLLEKIIIMISSHTFLDTDKQMINNLPIAAIVSDLEGNIVSANNLACQQFKYDRDEINELKIKELIPSYLQSTYKGFVNYSKKIPSKRLVENEKFVGLTKTNEIIPVEISFAPLKRYYNTLFLACIVDDSDHQDDFQNLIKSNKSLVKTNYELDAFVYKVSHDLRSPIATSLGLINICRLENKQQNLEQYLKMQEQSLVSLDALILEIKDFMENARSEVIIEPVKLKELLNACLERFKLYPSFRAIAIDNSISGNLIINADKQRLKTIFNNIISNTMNFKDPSKDCFLKIEATNKRSNIEISFEDNGIGISANSLPKIWNMFYRGSEGSFGSGLGLYMVKEVTTRLGGSVNVKSEIHKGTKLFIKLPLNK